MDDARDANLDEVLIGGREHVAITVVDYDQQWSRRFEETAERVRGVLGGEALSVEHIGSTSVPGLAAKPIADMILTVADVADEAACVSALESIGFVLRVREPGHRILRAVERDTHPHVYQPDRAEVRDYLDLRDWLRVDAEDRALRHGEAAARRAAMARHERLRRRQDRHHPRHPHPRPGLACGHGADGGRVGGDGFAEASARVGPSWRGRGLAASRS